MLTPDRWGFSEVGALVASVLPLLKDDKHCVIGCELLLDCKSWINFLASALPQSYQTVCKPRDWR